MNAKRCTVHALISMPPSPTHDAKGWRLTNWKKYDRRPRELPVAPYLSVLVCPSLPVRFHRVDPLCPYPCTDPMSPSAIVITQAEEEVKKQQATFDRQYEITKLLLERVEEANVRVRPNPLSTRQSMPVALFLRSGGKCRNSALLPSSLRADRGQKKDIERAR